MLYKPLYVIHEDECWWAWSLVFRAGPVCLQANQVVFWFTLYTNVSLLSWFVLVEAYCELPTDVVKINKTMESLLSFVFVKCPENVCVSCIFY